MSTPAKKNYVPMVLIGCALTSLGVCSILFVNHILKSEAPPPKKLVQAVKIIRPPPPEELPPPPPPPPEEKVDLADPPPTPDPVASNEPPPGDLGLDADGTAGGDSFGLLGRKGGRDLLGTNGSAYTWYANLLKGAILEKLQNLKAARSGAYSVSVKAWTRPDGTIEKIRLAQSTGDRERDRAIEAELATIGRLAQAPPDGLPQPMSLRLVSRT
ncbi:MAG TPA: TonB C-terminal domain-containing protein [Steroidobacteraceae bacterium]|nr:TonB C-terminal domain-containing protein [Steroidobacteraceae bacterium]